MRYLSFSSETMGLKHRAGLILFPLYCWVVEERGYISILSETTIWIGCCVNGIPIPNLQKNLLTGFAWLPPSLLICVPLFWSKA